MNTVESSLIDLQPLKEEVEGNLTICKMLINSFIKDVDEYHNNEFAFVVEWYPNDEYGLITERIEVECSYSHLTGNAEFTLVNEEVTKFGRTWKIVKSLNLLEQENGFPIWWKVLEMEDGVLWMNNCNGEMAFVENDGRILKTII